jgi:starch-binding outer membrane protein, SusD/RagB family
MRAQGERRRLSSSARLVLVLSLLVAAASCTDITSLAQENPGQLSAGDLYVPANAQLLVNGAIADFECAFSRYTVGIGLFTDELANAIASSGNIDYDRRTLTGNASYGTGTCANNQQPPIYTTLAMARASADTAVGKLSGWTDAQVPNRTKLIGQASVYAGYTLVLMGESMCSAAINLGPELKPADLFAEAKKRFDAAIAAAGAAGDAKTVSFATLGRARAEWDLAAPGVATDANLVAAAADAATITDPAFAVTLATSAANVRQQNWVFVSVNQNSWATIDPSFRNLTVDNTPNGAPDPRTLVTDLHKVGTSQSTPIWTANKYSTLATTIPIAKYAEAQLIIAEFKASTDPVGAAAAINNARNTHPGMPQYSATGQTTAQILSQIVEERRRELFLEGHRLGDVHHFRLAILPAAGANYLTNGVYGDQSCFPLPDVERINNPTIGGH